MKTIYILLGHIFLCLGLIGIILPILPTTPFLLLTAYFFAKGSKRFQHWFEQTKIYQKHLEPFIRTKSMTRKQKMDTHDFCGYTINHIHHHCFKSLCSHFHHSNHHFKTSILSYSNKKRHRHDVVLF